MGDKVQRIPFLAQWCISFQSDQPAWLGDTGARNVTVHPHMQTMHVRRNTSVDYKVFVSYFLVRQGDHLRSGPAAAEAEL